MASRHKEHKIAVPELVIPDKDKCPPPLLTPPSPASTTRQILTKQSSQKMNCLCSPTTHVGSFRCRHHRSFSLIRNSGSVGSGLSEYGGGSGSLSSRMSSGLSEYSGGTGSFRSRQSSSLSDLSGSSRPFGSQLSELTDGATAGGTSVGV